MLTVAITQNYVNGSLALNLTCLRTYTINSYYKCLHITKFVACFSYSTFYYHYIFSSFIFLCKMDLFNCLCTFVIIVYSNQSHGYRGLKTTFTATILRSHIIP